LASSVTKKQEIRAEVDLESIREWFAYNDYVRKKYLTLLETLPCEQLTKDTGASFPSLLDISAHIFYAYRLWLKEMYTGLPLEAAPTLSFFLPPEHSFRIKLLIALNKTCPLIF